MHAREAERGWVCITCAQEATTRGRRTIYTWTQEHPIRTERARGRVYFNLADLVSVEAAVRLGRPPKDDPQKGEAEDVSI